jgi:hypothetical protein
MPAIDTPFYKRTRFHDALIVQDGACNPIAIVSAIERAIKEVGGTSVGTAELTGDPAVRLLVHQLAFICNIAALDDLGEYSKAVDACKKRTGG